MDEQERLTDLRRRAIFTLLMLAGGSAILALQGEREAQPAPLFARGSGTGGASAVPLPATRGSFRPFNATAARAAPPAQPATSRQWRRSTP